MSNRAIQNTYTTNGGNRDLAGKEKNMINIQMKLFEKELSKGLRH